MTAVAVRPPTFLQRLSTAFKAGRQAAVLAYGVPTWQDGQVPQYTDRTFGKFVDEGYQKNELIYSCLTANADSAASVSLKVYSKGDHEEIDDHPLRRLMKRPSPFLSEFDFWALTSIYEDLAGAAYWQKIRNNAGEVIELFPLRPDWIKIVPSSTTFIAEYVYDPGDPTQVRHLPTRDVLVFKRFDPRNLRDAINPTKVVARSGDVDNALTDYLKLLEEKGFEPRGVLKSKLTLQDSDVDEILRRLEDRYAGMSNWHKPIVLDRDAEYQRTSFSMAEMDFTSQDERNEARICAIYQVPPIIVGARIGLRYGTYANYQEARLSWWEDKLTPRYKHRSDVINAQLAPEFDEDIETEFDTSRVPALQEKKRAERQQYADEFAKGLITRNMFYQKIGEDQLPPETGDVFIQSIAVNSIPIDGPAEPPPPAQPPVVPGDKPAEPPPDTPPDTPLPADEPAQPGAKVADITPVTVMAQQVLDLKARLKVVTEERDNLRATLDAAPPPVDVEAIVARIEPYTPDGQLRQIAETLAKRAEPAADEKPTEPAPEPAPLEEPAPEASDTESKGKAAKPLPFDDLLTVSETDVKRWETMYQRLQEKAHA